MRMFGLITALAALDAVTGVASTETTAEHDDEYYPPPFTSPATLTPSTTCPAYGLGHLIRDGYYYYENRVVSEASRRMPRPKRSSPLRGQPQTDPPTPEGTPQEKGGWSRGALCRRVGKDEHCAFTYAEFNNGEGISIITTAARILLLGSQPPLAPHPATDTETANKRSKTDTTPSESHYYKDVTIPNKGIGLLATQPIRTGRRVMARTPAVMVDDRAFKGLRKEDLALLLGQAILALPDAHRKRFLNLSIAHDEAVTGGGSLTAGMELIYNIFTNNAFKTTVTLERVDKEGGGGGVASSSEADFQSAFTEVSRLNHDCSPNLGYYFDSATLSQKVYAARDIMPGEELTVSYVDVLQPRSTRSHLLNTTWHFTCSCARCSPNPANPADDTHILLESDSRTSQIRSLLRSLDDYTTKDPNPATHGPQKAETLITLYELEGLQVRIYEAYYRAALEWNGVGDAERAVRYARLCLASGLVLRGPDRPFVRSMRALVEDARAHWSWRFRVPVKD
ncbi:hypothetical protein B0T19DRAFT_434152 [Cercophora scortea]|uniref:SET domain-containing protein n=1 Tax=Cercophora scortea TaxID=314031 RepID=A0AAE0I8H7_9PEZI|nr:hypothetical protein B0T19DRAFT_434152 [Cercophora scortea]